MFEMDINDEMLIDRIWNKGTIVDGYDPNLFRKDPAGAWIARSEYGNRESKFGWEIDHVYPKALGGDDQEINLRPMQWQNNLSKGDSYPDYIAVVQSDDNQNIDMNSARLVRKELQNKLAELYNMK